MSPKSREVFLLGAGFSKSVGVPLQKEILPLILGKTESEAIHNFKFAAKEFLDRQKRIGNLLSESFPSSDETPLEDIFTVLDLSISKFTNVASYRWQEQFELRQALIGAIAFVLHACVEDISNREEHVVRDFATFLLEKRVAAGLSADVVSVIHVNWDSLLEEEIFSVLESSGQLGAADVDYCCYTSPMGSISLHTPSVQQKVSGKFNVKIQKLHGSLNWLVCPSCDRLLTGLGMEEFEREKYLTSQYCPECAEVAPELAHVAQLQPYIICPTFLKAFHDHHIQSVWHNAFLDLRAAPKLTLIGYSLPEADYHIRALLRRADIHKKEEVNVVLHERDREGFDQLEGPAGRIKRFLGLQNPNVHFFFNGAEDYFRNELKVLPTTKRLSVLKGRFTRAAKTVTAR